MPFTSRVNDHAASRFEMRITASERVQLREDADLAGMSISEFVRRRTFGKTIHASQLDWMIAVRMRVTGHDQLAITQALKKNASSDAKLRIAIGPTTRSVPLRPSLAHAATGSTTGAHSAPRHGRESKAETFCANARCSTASAAQFQRVARETLRSNDEGHSPDIVRELAHLVQGIYKSYELKEIAAIRVNQMALPVATIRKIRVVQTKARLCSSVVKASALSIASCLSKNRPLSFHSRARYERMRALALWPSIVSLENTPSPPRQESLSAPLSHGRCHPSRRLSWTPSFLSLTARIRRWAAWMFSPHCCQTRSCFSTCAFAVLPKPAALFQPTEGSFDDPTFRQHGKPM